MNRASSATGWVRNPDGSLGWTWNPITGCRNHVNGLCKGGNFPCYAYRLAHGRLRQRYLANINIAQPEPKPLTTLSDVMSNIRTFQDVANGLSNPFYPRFWPERLKEIQRGYHFTDWSGACEHSASAKGIFVCDMSDLFGVSIPEAWTKEVLEAIKRNGKDRFYLLTKQPQNLSRWSPFPENCWVGFTATDDIMFRIGINQLRHVKAAVKFISLEPLLSWQTGEWHTLASNWMKDIKWLIIGAQTRPSVFPKLEWVREIVEAADKAGVAVFLKDNLAPILPIGYMFSMPGNKGVLRQEMPNG